MIHARAAVMIALSSSLAGCLPIPNIHYFAPAVSGTVVQDGHAVEGAEVRVTGQFSSEVQLASTDASGRFSAKPIRELRLTAMLVGDPLYGHSVEISAGGKHYDGYVDSSVGYGPSELQLTCDLARPVQMWRKTVYCTVVAEAR